MFVRTLVEVECAIRSSWGVDTCAPEDIPQWHEGNPARGQCGTTALVINDLLGGDLVCGEVHVDGQWVDYHWWNRLAGGIELDLTREQFDPEELVVGGTVIKRPPEIVRLREEYELLRARVIAALEPGESAR
ncbi:YunG family protein [Saccharopolyspora sp. NPDC002376]